MNNNNDIPEGWSMPDNLAKKINEGLNKKTLRPEDELADALEEIARDIALIEPDPEDWGGWVMYLLEQMEAEAKRREKKLVLMRSLRENLNLQPPD
jgi:hypothetical protein